MTGEQVAAGRVTLVGAGPGDPDLLTVAAVQALDSADVVLYDRLAPSQNLTALAPRAVLVDVGKRPGHHPVSQERIEAMMVEHAAGGAHVVRLKGGDSFVFGRGGEEVEACQAAGIPVTVIPGVTSAIAVPGSVGIPVTHRGLSRLFTTVSGHAPLSDDELAHLAALGGTIVVLMGVSTLPMTAAGLIRAGMNGHTPVAIIERGFSSDQRTIVGELHDIHLTAVRAGVASPAVIVIGDVVSVAGSPGVPSGVKAGARGVA